MSTNKRTKKAEGFCVVPVSPGNKIGAITCKSDGHTAKQT